MNLYYNSPVVLTFFFICLGILIFNTLSKGVLNTVLFSTYRASILSPLMYVRLVGHIFGHQGWSHFMSNFLTILLIGPMIEEKYGSLNLLYMMIVLSSFVNVEAGKIPVTLILIFIFYLINEVILSFFRIDNVSHMGHLIGAVCGIVFGIYLS